jgi:uncharacterized protein
VRDLTPALPPVTNIAKANPFIHFLANELIPFVDHNFKTAPYRVLAGHSLGGLTAIDLLSNFPQYFNAYLAIDPSMWYKNEVYLKNAIAKWPVNHPTQSTLFVATANTMPAGMLLAQLKTNKSPATQHIRSIYTLDEWVKTNPNGLKYEQVFYEKEKHNTVPLLSLYDGLKFIFNYFALDVQEKDFINPTAHLANKLKIHYTAVSRQMGYPVAAPMDFINYLAYDALDKKQLEKAAALFELNLQAYPKNSKANEAYADVLLAKKDTSNAITYYQKAIAIKEDPLPMHKLNTLLKQSTYAITEVALQKYQGIYILETYNIAIELLLQNGQLIAKVPGQADDVLVPIAANIFTTKTKQSYSITFLMNGNKPTAFIAVQPNGTFRANYKTAR